MIAPFSELKEIHDSFSDKDKEFYGLGNKSINESKYTIYRDIKKVNNKPVAFIDVDQGPTDKKNNDCNISVGCKPEYRGKGYTKKLLLRFMNSEGKKFNKVWYGFDKGNKSSKEFISHINGFKYMGGKNNMDWYAYSNEISNENYFDDSALFDSYNYDLEPSTEGETWDNIKEGARKLWAKVCELWTRFWNWVKDLITNNRLAQWIKKKFCRTDLSKWDVLKRGYDQKLTPEEEKGVLSEDELLRRIHGVPSSFIGFVGQIDAVMESTTGENVFNNKLNELADIEPDDIYDTMSGNHKITLNSIFELGKDGFKKLEKESKNLKSRGDKALKEGSSAVLTAVANFFKRAIKLVFIPFKFICECLKRDKETTEEMKNVHAMV